MKPSAVVLLIAALFRPLSSVDAQTSQEGLHAPDAGTMEIVLSISIPPLTKAPFTSTVRTEWVRTLEDGSKITLQNHRIVMRDSTGRIFQERRHLVPNGQEPELARLEITDPSMHTQYICYPNHHACELYDYSAPPFTSAAPVGVVGEGNEYLTREDLGKDSVSGLDAVGTRETTTINAGTIGNERPLSTTKEFWYSPQLGINLLVKRVDPRHGIQIFTVSDIGLAEPDPKYFSVPNGFTVSDRRSADKPSRRSNGQNQ
jgi:hypothetical protein